MNEMHHFSVFSTGENESVFKMGWVGGHYICHARQICEGTKKIVSHLAFT